MSRVLSAAALSLLLLTLPSQLAASESAAPRMNCAPPQRSRDLEPIDAGPLALAAVYCQSFRTSSFPVSTPIVSPDGRSIAYYDYGSETLRIAPLDRSDGLTSYPASVHLFIGAGGHPVASFSWASNSHFVWIATQDKMRPSGFATTPVRVAQTGENGNLVLLPTLQGAAGPLDGLRWINGDGLALAELGTRGSLYRPQHDDQTPTFAIVDAQRGLVLDTLPFDAIAFLQERSRSAPPYVLIKNVAATKLDDGKVRAVLKLGQWVVWTQGEAPRTLPDPYPGSTAVRMALSPNGSSILVTRRLRTEGGMCVFTGGCSPGRPVEGVLAASHDVATGRALWTIRAVVAQDYDFPAPAISPDGRYALIGLVPNARPLIALVAMDDGRIMQTIPAPGAAYVTGFTRGGSSVWTNAYGLTAVYDVRPAAQ